MYDLSNGMAAGMSMMLIGQQVNAVYHTSIELFGVEYFYGGGIARALPGTVQCGKLLERRSLGVTDIDQETFEAWLDGMREEYMPEKYNIFTHNCNNFS